MRLTLQTFRLVHLNVFQPDDPSILWNKSPREQVDGGSLPLKTRGFLRPRYPFAAGCFRIAAVCPFQARGRTIGFSTDLDTGIASTFDWNRSKFDRRPDIN